VKIAASEGAQSVESGSPSSSESGSGSVTVRSKSPLALPNPCTSTRYSTPLVELNVSSVEKPAQPLASSWPVTQTRLLQSPSNTLIFVS